MAISKYNIKRFFSRINKLLKTRVHKNQENEIWSLVGKMRNDCWPNIVVLTCGRWFISDTASFSYRVGSHDFIDFQLCGGLYTSYGNEARLEEKNKITDSVFRRISVRVDRIGYIIEYDS